MGDRDRPFAPAGAGQVDPVMCVRLDDPWEERTLYTWGDRWPERSGRDAELLQKWFVTRIKSNFPQAMVVM